MLNPLRLLQGSLFEGILKHMSLYTQWTDMVVEFVKTKGEKAFWDVYSTIEEEIYRKILSAHQEKHVINIADLAKAVDTTPQFVMGFLDGINESLKQPLNLEELDSSSSVTLDIDLESLYYNMLDAKADYLYTLPQWDGIFSEEKRREIKKSFQDSKTIRNEVKVGRNDPCPCGSGKKYKKCHGANNGEAQA